MDKIHRRMSDDDVREMVREEIIPLRVSEEEMRAFIRDELSSPQMLERMHHLIVGELARHAANTPEVLPPARPWWRLFGRKQ